MKTNTTTTNYDLIKDNVNVNDEVAKTGVGLVMLAGGLVGLWAAACLIGGVSSGIGGVVKGYILAVIGG